MIRRESKFSVLFRHWLKANPRATAALEMKQTKTDSLAFSEVKEAQINYGMAIKSDHGVMIRTEGVEGLPDYIYLRSEPSFIVVRYPSCFCIIDVGDFDQENKTSKKRSLTSARARQIAIETVDL